MKLSDSVSMTEYIKKMTEIFDELAVIAKPVSDEDKVVYLLMRLPESYYVLVTPLENGSDTVEMVTECLLREEQKLKDREGPWQEASYKEREEAGHMSLM